MQTTSLPRQIGWRAAAVFLFAAVGLLVLAVSTRGLPGEAPAPAVGDLDPEGCTTFAGSKGQAAKIPDVSGALGLSRPGPAPWSAGSARETTVFHYRIG